MSLDALFGGGDSGAEKPSEAERALAQKAAIDWNYYVKNYGAVEDAYVKRITDYKSDRADQMGASASTAAAKALDVSGERMSKLKTTGMPGNSAAVLKATMTDANNYRKGLAGAAPAVEGALVKRETAGKNKLIALQRGLSDAADVTLAEQGRRATEERINEAQAKQAADAAMVEAFGTAAGAYAAPYVYKNRMDKIDGMDGFGGNDSNIFKKGLNWAKQQFN